MAQIQHYDKRVGITYVYDSQSYYDPIKKQSRSKRKLIGKIDPETGEIVPTGKRGRPSAQPPASEETTETLKKLYLDTQKKLAAAETQIQSLQTELTETRSSLISYKKRLKEIADLCEKKI